MSEYPPPPTLPPAPTPLNSAVLFVAGGLALVTVIGVIIVTILRPGDIQTITAIGALGGSLVAAFLGLTATRGIQVVHQQLNSRMDAYLAVTRQQATDQATLIERAAAAVARDAAATVTTEAALVASEAAAKAAAVAATAAVATALNLPIPPPQKEE